MAKEIFTINLNEFNDKLKELGFEDIECIGYYIKNNCHKKLILKHNSFETEYIWSELKVGKIRRLSERYRLSKEGILKYCDKVFEEDDIIDVEFLNPEKKSKGNCNFISKTKGNVTWNLHTIFSKSFEDKDSLFGTNRLSEKSVLDRIHSYIDKEDVVNVDYSKSLHNPTVTFKFKGRMFTRNYHSLCRTWNSTKATNFYHTEDNILTNLKDRFGITNIVIEKLYNCDKSKKTRLKADIICTDDGKIARNVDVCKMLYRGYWFSNISSGEYMIANYMIDNNIKFETQKTFEDLRYKALLRFDFYLPEYNTCIEYDGGQHYGPIEAYGGEEKYQLTKKRDSIKNNYCKIKGINLVRIPYWKLRTLGNLDIYFQDIVSSS